METIVLLSKNALLSALQLGLFDMPDVDCVGFIYDADLQTFLSGRTKKSSSPNSLDFSVRDAGRVQLREVTLKALNEELFFREYPETIPTISDLEYWLMMRGFLFEYNKYTSENYNSDAIYAVEAMKEVSKGCGWNNIIF